VVKIKRIHPQNIFHFIMWIIIIAIVSIMLVGGYLYCFCFNAIYSEFMSGNKQYVLSIENSHEKDMEVVDRVVTQMSISEGDTKFLTKKSPEKGMALIKHLKSYTLTSSFYNTIFYHYAADDYLYNHSTSVSEKYFLYRENLLENTSTEELRNILEGSAVSSQILPEQSVIGEVLGYYVGRDTSVTTIVRTISAEKDEVLLFFIPASYYDHLLSAEIFDRDLSFLYKDGQFLVSRGDKELVGEELRSHLQASNKAEVLDENEMIQQEISLKGETYLLSITKGNSGICYGVVQDKNRFYEKLWSDQIMVVILIAASILIVILGVIFLSRVLIRRVKNINEMLYEKEIYDLESIEYGIQSLIREGKEKEKVNLTLKKVQFIRSFINGELQEREKVIAEAEKVQLKVNYNRYIVVLLRQEEVNCERKIYDLLLSVIEEQNDMSGYGIHLVGQNQDLFVLFGNTSDTLENGLQKMFEIERQWGQKFVFAVSEYHTDFKNAPKAYLEADTAFDYHVILIGDNIIRFRNIIQYDYTELLPDNYLAKLRKAIYASDKNAIDVLILEIYNIIKDKKVSLYSTRVFYNKILQMLIAEWNGDDSAIEKFYNVFSLTQCVDLQDFCSLLSDMCNMMIDNGVGKKIEYSDVVQRADSYMQEHYSAPELTVDFLADCLNVSAAALYISFKNEMAIGPAEYLANLRLEKAKELLCNTDMLIKEISVAVGYYDEGSFSRRFKKHTGVTPGQYREKHTI